MKKIIICLFAIALMTCTGFSLGIASAKEEVKPLFEQKCSQCHSIERPKSLKKTGKEWEQTVMRMKNSNGAPLSDAEAKLVIEYLTTHYGR